MKKTEIKSKQNSTEPVEENLEIVDETTDEITEVISIQEFIELKKLQNRVLEKMLENMNSTENQNKPNNK